MNESQLYPVAHAPVVGPNGEHIVQKESEVSHLTAWAIVCALNKYVATYTDWSKLLRGAHLRRGQ